MLCAAGGDHAPGDPECCANNGGCDYDQRGWTYQDCQVNCSQPEIIVENPDNPPGNGGGLSPGDIATQSIGGTPCATPVGGTGIAWNTGCIGLNQNPSDPAECAKIKSFLNNPANSTFKNSLLYLSNLSGPQPPLNENFETGVVSNVNIPNATVYQGTANKPILMLPPNPSTPYNAIAHTHPNIPPGAFSVFSPSDLTFLAALIADGKVTGDITLYLTTKKGTQYAMIVTDPQKLVDLFYSQIYANSSKIPSNGTTQFLANDQKFNDAKKNYKKLFDTYFDKNTGSIKETDTNNEGVLTEFMNFLNEGDAGVKLFDASPVNPGDPPFDKFREIELINGVPVRKNPC